MSDLAKILSGAVRSAPHGETQLRPYGPTRTIWDRATAGAVNAADHELIQSQPEVDESDY